MIDGLKDKHREAIIGLLSKHEGVERVVLFGSRAMETHTPTSDVDIMLYGKSITLRDQSYLAEKIEGLNVPQSVDIVLFSEVKNEKLKAHVEKEGVVWFERVAGEGVCSAGALLFKDAAILAHEKIDPENAVGKKYVGLEHIKPDSLVLSSYGYAGDVASSKSTFKKGDILFGKLRPYFRKVIIAPFDGICSTDIWVVRAKKNVDQTFLYYWMASREFVDNATRGSEGTRMPRAKWDYVGRFESSITDKNEQITIGQVLKSLDDKIELNRRMCETLEKIASTLFKSWFVDFDPVRAKSEGRVPEGMSSDLLDLFPDSFEDSDLGMIPKGWKVNQLGTEFDLLMGQSPPGNTYNEEQKGVPFFQGTRDFGFRYPSNRVWCSASKRIANPGDTLVSVRAPVGEVNMALEEICIGRGVATIRHKTSSRSYTYYCIKSLGSSFKVYEDGGTIFGSINKTDFSKMKVLGFRREILSEFEKICFPVDTKIEEISYQTSSLTIIRDTLLPKLISGELRVKDMEGIL